jgi:hypothetical protein
MPAIFSDELCHFVRYHPYPGIQVSNSKVICKSYHYFTRIAVRSKKPEIEHSTVKGYEAMASAQFDAATPEATNS